MFRFFISVIDFIFPKKNYIVFTTCKGDFSNNEVFYEFILNKPFGYKCFWVTNNDANYSYILKKYNVVPFRNHSFKGILLLFFTKFIFTTQGGYTSFRNTNIINLWHGIGLKNVGLLRSNPSVENLPYFPNNQLLFVSSKVDRLEFSSGWCINPNHIYVTGSPRTDILFNKNNQNLNFNRVLNYFSKSSKNYLSIGLFAPTFKVNDGFNEGVSRVGNLFCFKNNFDLSKFNYLLKKNNILLFIKFHPYDEDKLINIYRNQSNIKIITGDILKSLNITVYDFLSNFDFLMTDYSSLAFDYLILNKPIFSIIPDFKIYAKKRSFLLDPLEFWLPGKKIYSYDQLKVVINKKFKLNKLEFDSLSTMSKIRHTYQDNLACERIFNIIRKKM